MKVPNVTTHTLVMALYPLPYDRYLRQFVGGGAAAVRVSVMAVVVGVATAHDGVGLRADGPCPRTTIRGAARSTRPRPTDAITQAAVMRRDGPGRLPASLHL